MKKKLFTIVPMSAFVTAASVIPAFAAEGAVDVNTMLTTSMTSVQADMLGTITSLTPIALVVVGAVLAVR